MSRSQPRSEPRTIALPRVGIGAQVSLDGRWNRYPGEPPLNFASAMLKLLGLIPAAELSKLFYGPKVIDFARRRQNHFGKKFPQLVSRIACKPQTRFYRLPF